MNRTHFWELLLILALFSPSLLRAENPFSGDSQSTDISDFEEDDGFLNDPVDNFGFEPPENLKAAPPPPTFKAPTRAQAAPPSPPPQPITSSPPPSRVRPPTQARRTVTPPSRRSSPPPRVSPPPEPSGNASAPEERGGRPKIPKLADYLELDSSIKGLQVKNFDLPDKDIRDVVTLISKWTGKNFILDSKVRGKITILGPSQVTLQEAYHAFLSALEANGLTTVQSGKFIRVIESAEARRSPVEIYAGDFAPQTDQFITRIFQLRYINADEVQREFRDLTTRQGKLFAYAPTNSIIITDTGNNIHRIEKILRTLDIKGFETSLHLIRLNFTSSKQIAQMLEEIYDEDGGSSGSSRSRTRSRTRSLRKNSSERTRGGGIITKIIPDEQTNSLIVMANQIGFNQLKKLVAKLDVKVTDTGKIHVYYCEYAKAEDLASTLSSLSGGGGGQSRSGTSRNSRGGTSAVRARTAAVASSPVSAELEGGIKVTADASTNALVITANSADYQTLKKVIRKLDIPRLQVFVETAILEVALNDRDERGVNYAAAANGRAFVGGFIGDRAKILDFVTGGLPAGASLPILLGNRVQAEVGGTTINLRSFNGLLSFIARNTATSILSTPQIIALDNEEAVFKVQDEIPVQTGIPGTSVGTTNTSSVGSIERLKTGIEIKLTPNINQASRTVRLEIEQKVDSVKANADVPQDLANIQRATTTRETNTKVVVRDRDFVMLGGLMSDRVEDSETKIPLLGDIPILGWLFKSSNRSVVKTNLVILLHPRIIGTTLDNANLISDKLDQRRKFIEDHAGGDDAYEEQVDEMRGKLDNQFKRGRNSRESSYRSDLNDDDDDPRMDKGGKSSGSSKDFVRPDPKSDSFYGESDTNEALMLPSDAELDAMPDPRRASNKALQTQPAAEPNANAPVAPLDQIPDEDSDLFVPGDNDLPLPEGEGGL